MDGCNGACSPNSNFMACMETIAILGIGEMISHCVGSIPYVAWFLFVHEPGQGGSYPPILHMSRKYSKKLGLLFY